MRPHLILAVLTALGAIGCAPPPAEEAVDASARESVIIKKNGGWCWYQDERAIIVDGKLIVGSVAAVTRDGSDAGDVEVTTYDLGTGDSSSFKLAPKFQADDHNVPGFLVLPDGHILGSFMTHGGRDTEASTRSMHWRITTRPADATDWDPVQIQDVGGGISYTNLFMLSAEDNRIYNFHRCRRDSTPGNNPNYMISDDGGKSFRYGGRLLFWIPDEDDPKFTRIDGGRPYLKYASNNVDTIHFVATEDHPRAYDNSIYHGYIKGGEVHRSNGSVVGPLSTTEMTAIGPTDLTRVFEGGPDNVAWTIDLHLDPVGNPYTVFSVQTDGSAERGNRGATQIGQDHRFYYARWDGNLWNTHEMAYAGTRLYPGEDDYTGLAALHPHDPNTVYISTNADPVSGEPLISAVDGERHREIFRGVTADGGVSWDWTPVTENSSADNLRPIIPIWQPGRTALLWARGTLRTYTDYDLDIVGIID
jgi:putative BNR repeat neuraminidase